MKHPLGLYVQNAEGAILRGYFSDAREAKWKCEEVAAAERCECFVYSFDQGRELVRCSPASIIRSRNPFLQKRTANRHHPLTSAQ